MAGLFFLPGDYRPGDPLSMRKMSRDSRENGKITKPLQIGTFLSRSKGAGKCPLTIHPVRVQQRLTTALGASFFS